MTKNNKIYKDLSGEAFASLTAIKRITKTINNKQKTYYLCRCKCGHEEEYRGDYLPTRKSVDCEMCHVSKKRSFVCSQCGTEYEKYISKERLLGNRKFFCSVKCRYGWQANPLNNQWGWGPTPCEYNANNAAYYQTLYNNDAYPQQKRRTTTYKQWRINVYKRDFFTCQCCGRMRKGICAHHVKPFHSIYNEQDSILYDVNNGITLCKSCHYKYHKMFGIADGEPHMVREFISSMWNHLN